MQLEADEGPTTLRIQSLKLIFFNSLTTDNHTQATDHPTTIEMASYATALSIRVNLSL